MKLARLIHPTRRLAALFGLATLLAWQAPAQARNIDLSTVPARATVQLTIYNSEDLTLVRETRQLSFKKGNNPLQFSWANTLIDPTSVELRFRDHGEALQVVDTTFPHDKPDMLYWNVQSQFDGAAQVEISYFTSGIHWSADYLAIANPAETELSLESFVRVDNHSGEDYDNAQVRLVVGTINLVENIRQLAEAAGRRLEDMDAREKKELRLYAAKAQMMADEAMPAPAMATGDLIVRATLPKEVAKEGLSEYFIYTIEGTETIPDGWSKRLRSFQADAVPFSVEYRYRPQEYGDALVRLYLLRNDTDSKLGTTPLPEGMLRVFRDNGQDGLSFLVEQHLKYVPIGDKVELNLGQNPEVVFELITLRVFRDELWMLQHGPEVYRKVDGGVKIDLNSSVSGWDEHTVYSQRVRNYSAKPITLEIRRSYDGDTLFRSQLDPSLHDYRTVQFNAEVKAGERADLYYEIVQRQGYNAKQNKVEREAGEVRL